jgi:hypothetical protein
MIKSQLPPELISLVNYVELNRSGWYDKIVQRMILSVIWITDINVAFEKIADVLRNNFSIQIDDVELKNQIEVVPKIRTGC